MHRPLLFGKKPLYSHLKECSKGIPWPIVVLPCYPSANRKTHFWARGLLSGWTHTQWQGWGGFSGPSDCGMRCRGSGTPIEQGKVWSHQTWLYPSGTLAGCSPEHATLLGSALGVWSLFPDMTKMLEVMGDGLQHLHAQDAILLLHHAFTIPSSLTHSVHPPALPLQI